MGYYNECPLCGCSLDPGERCDCTEKQETEKQREEKPAAQKIIVKSAVKSAAKKKNRRRTFEGRPERRIYNPANYHFW